MYVFQLPTGRLIKHITTGSLRMALYTKELHLFTFEEWAKGGSQNLQWCPELQSSAASASYLLRARSPALHLSLGNVPDIGDRFNKSKQRSPGDYGPI